MKKYIYAVILFSSLFILSCRKSYFDINKNPNQASEGSITPDLILPLAQHDMGSPHAGDCVCLPPPVAVEHRQRMQVYVAIADTGMPAKCGGVGPGVAMGDLNTFGACRGARRVVDRGGGVLVGRP